MLSPIGLIVRQHDPDRFLTALFAPPLRREALLTLYAFNHEVARARDLVREPMMAMVRWQWWREVLDGARRRHEVAGPVGDALDSGLLQAPDLHAIIDGRELEVDGLSTLDEWRAYVLATAGGVAVAAAHALGGEHEAVRALGAAYGAAGLMRAAPGLLAQGRALLPPGGIDAARAEGLAWLGAGRVPRLLRPAVLIAALARRDLVRRDLARPNQARAEPALQRGLGDKLAVARMAWL